MLGPVRRSAWEGRFRVIAARQAPDSLDSETLIGAE